MKKRSTMYLSFRGIDEMPIFGKDLNGIMFAWSDGMIRYYPNLIVSRGGFVALPSDIKEKPIAYALVDDTLDFTEVSE